MALWFPIMVNDLEVGTISLVRIDPVDHTPGDNEVCTYDLKYYVVPHWSKPDIKTTIEFPYQRSNPIPLLSAALEEIKRCQNT